MSGGVLHVRAVKNVVLFGGGLLLVDIALESMRRRLGTTVFAVPRHLSEVLEPGTGLTLGDMLSARLIPFVRATDVNDSAELRAVLGPNTIGIGIGEAYVFSGRTIELFGGQLFDFMTIRLPQYRGGAHCSWQILRGARVGAWNIQLVDQDMVPGRRDTGALVMTREYPIPASARLPRDYMEVGRREGLQLFVEFLNRVDAGAGFPLSMVQEEFSVFLPRLNTQRHGFIDWSWRSEEIERFIRAFDEPYSGASTFIGNLHVRLHRAQLDRSEGGFHPFAAGLIYRLRPSAVFIATSDGAIVVESVVSADGESVLGSIAVGQRCHTPRRYLEAALGFEAEYDAEGPVS